MSDLLIIGGLIPAETDESVRSEFRSRAAAGLSLPLAGALLLHLGILCLFLAVPRWSGEKKSSPVLYPVRLYNVAEMAAVKGDEGARPVTAGVRRAATAPQLEAAGRSPGIEAHAVLQAKEEVDTRPLIAESPLLSAAPAEVAPAVDPVGLRSGDSHGVSSSAGSSRWPVESGVVSLPVGVNSAGATGAAHAAPPLVLAHPLYSVNPEPEYPPLARRRGLEGSVVLEVLVDEQGAVSELTVQRSSGHRLLDDAALKSVKTWRFEPGRRGGEPQEMKVLVPVRFALR